MFNELYLNSGYVFIPSILDRFELKMIHEFLESFSEITSGDRRFLDHPWCFHLAQSLLDELQTRSLVPSGYVPVLCTYFSKTVEHNWSVPAHRDLFIPLRSESPAEGWEQWTVKQGIPHAKPPMEILRSMFALRLHVDAASKENGALAIYEESHRVEVAENSNPIFIEGEAGSALLMSPLLVHSSKKATDDSPRRVLHFLYGPEILPGEIEWYY